VKSEKCLKKRVILVKKMFLILIAYIVDKNDEHERHREWRIKFKAALRSLRTTKITRRRFRSLHEELLYLMPGKVGFQSKSSFG